MGALTNYQEGLELKAKFGDNYAAAIAPATWYVALFTAAPGETGGGTECSGTGYARVASANTSANWDLTNDGATDANADGVADDATVINASAIAFPAVGSGGWGTATHWGLFDAPTGGNLRIYAALTASVTLDAGDEPSFAAGSLSYQQDD